MIFTQQWFHVHRVDTYTLSEMPPKQAEANKKQEFVWTVDEAKPSLTRAEWSGCDPFLLTCYMMANQSREYWLT